MRQIQFRLILESTVKKNYWLFILVIVYLGVFFLFVKLFWVRT